MSGEAHPTLCPYSLDAERGGACQGGDRLVLSPGHSLEPWEALPAVDMGRSTYLQGLAPTQTSTQCRLGEHEVKTPRHRLPSLVLLRVVAELPRPQHPTPPQGRSGPQGSWVPCMMELLPGFLKQSCFVPRRGMFRSSRFEECMNLRGLRPASPRGWRAAQSGSLFFPARPARREVLGPHCPGSSRKPQMASGRGARAECSFPVPAHAHLDSRRSGPDPPGPSRCRQRSAREVFQHQARDLGLVLHRTGRQRRLWIKSRELGVVPGRQAETVAVTRGVRKRGTRRRESGVMTGFHAWRSTMAEQPGQ